MDYPTSMTNAEWRTHVLNLRPILSSFPVTAKEIFACEGGKHVTIWATSDARFREEVKDEEQDRVEWSYFGEYMFVLVLDETGEKIERIVEFLDSTKVVEIRKLIERASRNLAARGKASQ